MQWHPANGYWPAVNVCLSMQYIGYIKYCVAGLGYTANINVDNTAANRINESNVSAKWLKYH